MNSNVGIISVSYDLLREVLGLPDSTTILNVWTDYRILNGSLNITIEDPTLPLVNEGECIPMVGVELTTEGFQRYRLYGQT